LRAQEGQRSAAATFRKTIGLAERELTQAEAVLEAARQAHVESGFKAVKLAACEGVLGLRGVRSQVLAKALPGVEAAANAWLSRVAGGDVSLSLSATSELKGGGEVEKIGLSLKGLAGGHGYRAASGGQRRRVDVALLLALADIAGAARARAPETLWMDEIFDCLDEDGTTAVAGLLEELSRNRTVLVITHAPGAWLRAAAHIQVDAGRLVTI
jgi:DNA repair exonuclease SbcCD ATPase subunit